MGKQSQMTAVQRTEVVLQLLRREASAKVLARQCGVSEQTLYRWREEFIRGGQGALNGAAGQSGLQAELRRKEQQLAERDQLIGELTVANRILKKTAKFGH